ncbi:MAG TPA: efflux RND transporter periplasmic adaptor subunit [Thermoplasmata archaeon]|mgnify:CR=1 FL=1|nr:efflux RND transporter periplasmic adaptor subunit [Thermoplasmata archaeon]
MNKKKIGITVLVLAVLCLVGYGSWFYFGGEVERNEDVIEFSGTIEAKKISVAAQVAGSIQEVLVDEGEKVSEGDELIKIDAALLESQVKQVEAGVRAAQAAVDAAEDKSQEEKDVAQAELDQAQVALEMAQKQASYATIKSPIDGVVLSININMGEVFAPGMPLIVIGDMDKMELKIYVAEDKLGKIKIGQDVEVKVDSYPDHTFKGKITQIASEAEFVPSTVQTKEERVTTVFAVKVSLDNKGHILKIGMPADAAIDLR